METIEKKIAALTTKLEQAKAQKKLIEARKRAAASKIERSRDTRRKILIGAAVLANLETGEIKKKSLLGMLDAYLTRPDDRALFEFLPKDENQDQLHAGGAESQDQDQLPISVS